MTGPSGDGLVHPLPLRPGPLHGESVPSYLRRLAQVNHVEPSELFETIAGYTGALSENAAEHPLPPLAEPTAPRRRAKKAAA